MNVTEEDLYSSNPGFIHLKWDEVQPFILASLLLTISMLMNFIFKHWRWTATIFPESSILIFVGVLFGGLFVHCM